MKNLGQPGLLGGVDGGGGGDDDNSDVTVMVMMVMQMVGLMGTVVMM